MKRQKRDYRGVVDKRVADRMPRRPAVNDNRESEISAQEREWAAFMRCYEEAEGDMYDTARRLLMVMSGRVHAVDAHKAVCGAAMTIVYALIQNMDDADARQMMEWIDKMGMAEIARRIELKV